jgi:glycosyltransferase involved in cell wall biosynthesis
MSRVDVIVPCYNYGRFLRECVGSVLAQEGVEVRVLIIDDASQDDSEQVGRALAAEDRRVEFRRHAVNRGHIATYNEGLAWAGGDYLLLLSADDLLTPGALGRVAVVMDANPRAGFAHGRAVKTAAPDSDGFIAPAAYSWSVVPGTEWVANCCAQGANWVYTPTAVVRTAVQKRVGNYRPDLPHAGDFDMWLRIAARADVAFVDADQAYYRTHGTNMSRGYVGARDLDQLADAFGQFFAACRDLVPGAERLKALALGRVADHAYWGASRAFDAGDGAACRDLLALARRLNPALGRGRVWRLRCKQFLGPRAWAAVGPLVRRVRPSRRLAAAGG